MAIAPLRLTESSEDADAPWRMRKRHGTMGGCSSTSKVGKIAANGTWLSGFSWVLSLSRIGYGDGPLEFH
jgi:hypothetical protein